MKLADALPGLIQSGAFQGLATGAGNQ